MCTYVYVCSSFVLRAGLNSFYNQLAMTSLLYQQHQQLQTVAMAAVQEATTALTAGQNAKREGRKDESMETLPLLTRLNSEASGSSAEFGELKIPEIKSK